MDVVEVDRTEDRDVPVVADANAVEADAILPINRVKPHTDFDGSVESGLSKMLVIGMGKQRGAKIAHEWAVDCSFRNMILEITDRLLAELPVLVGVALVEDQHDDTAIVGGIRPDGFLDRERELLETAYDVMPTLPFDDVDVLVIDEQGKNVSGQGIDTNVIGRRPFAINEPAPDQPTAKRIFMCGLTEETHGNAMGIGSADFIHDDILPELEASTTLINAITASTVRGVRLPPAVETDRARPPPRSRYSASSTRRMSAFSASPTPCTWPAYMHLKHSSRRHASVEISELSTNPRRSSSRTGRFPHRCSRCRVWRVEAGRSHSRRSLRYGS